VGLKDVGNPCVFLDLSSRNVKCKVFLTVIGWIALRRDLLLNLTYNSILFGLVFNICLEGEAPGRIIGSSRIMSAYIDYSFRLRSMN